jgi:hypothetical protein
VNITVVTAGCGDQQTPQRLRFGDRTVEVVEVIDRWLAPNDRYFKVKGEDSAVYIVRHDTGSGLWQLVLFQRARKR